MATFDLGQVLAQAEAIKGMKRQGQIDALQQQYLLTRTANEKAAGQRAETQYAQEQQLFNTRMLNTAARSVAADPASASRWLPELVKAGVIAEGTDLSQMPPEQLQAAAQQLAAQTDTELQAYLQANPAMAELTARHDYTLKEIEARMRAESQLAEQANQNALGQIGARGEQEMQQLAATRQFQEQMAEREQGYAMEQLGARQQQQIAAQEAEALAQQQQLEQTWNTYQAAKQGLVNALGASETGPLAGRLPATTEEQQTAEGAIAAMAPVLKQLFRVAGEGQFTDKDQELLLNMVPKRTDQPEARRKKLENIDRIVRAKLGIPEQPTQQPAASGGWSITEIK